MGKQDWYRNLTWTPEIRAQFFARLKRSRNVFHKAQYIRIQAYTLQHDASPPLYETALELLDYLFKEYPDPSQLALAYLQKAQCLEAIGCIADSTQAYLSSLLAEETYPGAKPIAPIDFAMFVLRHKLRQYYAIALSNLECINLHTLFPIQEYEANAAHALILVENGKGNEARQYAIKALGAAKKTNSGFYNHPALGLVKQVDSQLHSQLEKIANG
jgi:hypothetical protein